MSKNRLRICLNPIVFVAILLTLVGCSSQKSDVTTPDLRDEEWLKKNNCPGCWRGLKIGDALSLVQGLPFVGGPVSSASEPGGFLCKKPVDANCIAMSFDSGKLIRIHLVLNYQITFEQVVQKLGTPDGFWITPAYPDGLKGCLLKVIWKERLLVLETADKSSFFGKDLCEKINENGGQFPHGVFVQNVIYMPKEDIEDIAYLWKGFSGK
jgi:hypothetical protein